MQDFIMDILDFLYDKGRNFITPKEMNDKFRQAESAMESILKSALQQREEYLKKEEEKKKKN